MGNDCGPAMAAEVLDEATVAGMQEFGKDPGRIFQELAAAFLEEAPRLLAEIEQAGSLCERDDGARVVHMLNGISSLMGATRLAKACEVAERAVRNEDPKGSEDAVELLGYETGRALSAVEELLRGSR
jgi:HPt (histidine-containing phosphotransfer) domain-containing protein